MSVKYSERFGFNRLGHWVSQIVISTECLCTTSDLKTNPTSTDLCYTSPMSEEFGAKWENLYAYDRRFMGGVCRDGALRQFLTHPTTHSLVLEIVEITL